MKMMIKGLSLVVALVVMAVPALATTIRPTGVLSGTGGLRTKGGEVAVMTVRGDNLFRVEKNTGRIEMNGVNPKNGSATIFKYAGTLGIMNGDDAVKIFDVAVTNAEHTGEGNSVTVMDIAGITGSAAATEVAHKIGSGWDFGIISQSPAKLEKVAIINETTDTRKVAAADFGTLIICAQATTITLPAASAANIGATIRFAQIADADLAVAGAVGSIIADGNAAADSISFATASHKIGAACRAVCVSSTKWLITNESSCAMTVTGGG